MEQKEGLILHNLQWKSWLQKLGFDEDCFKHYKEEIRFKKNSLRIEINKYPNYKVK